MHGRLSLLLRGTWRSLAGARCRVCGLVTSGPGLCEACAKELRPRLTDYCPGCGALCETAGQPPSLCGACRAAPRPWTGMAFYAEYGGPLRRAILRLKFGGGLAGLGLLAELARHAYSLHRERPGGLDPMGPDLVVAVPMHWRKLLRRGYNQSQELARAVAGPLGVPVAGRALRKIRHTSPQSRLKAKERRTNLAGAFEADRELVGEKSVLLVDDVMTTGATLDAASRALLESGARRVDVLVLARD
ncbi:ComF family protein [Fundidesulfovibrio putealis]|uniref:ComF family protein n=1 Tax=Fundidesulfovibrio putealis TaxID=270496 RepID=UPI0003F5C1F7|nr:ComF family protein [Fundidesulfovibrio putealis]